jgi:dinuclear metal center YbgI/SA1388 family protein
MASASLSEIVLYCDRTLRTAQVKDYDNAANGLQVENAGRITRIAATVDATLATVRLAIAAKADLLIVYHGLFWSPTHPWTGPRREIFRLLVEHDVAVYSSHLPLDAHPRLGNNAQLCAALGLKHLKPFFFEKDQFLGFQARADISRAELALQLQRILGHAPIILPGGPDKCRKIGVVTGGAGAELRKAAAEGVDTFITGEGPHWTYGIAEELGLNVLYGGHYATETFGVKALAAELSKRYKIPWSFLDHPTGL